ncbi:hypothetical protein [Streptomyces sp. NPDC021020]|uniref:hypothetical protein n=1 Tax=Streptomyces sp. NPDC021020 TaxID=3365109 RepID=UPI0037B2C5E5
MNSGILAGVRRRLPDDPHTARVVFEHRHLRGADRPEADPAGQATEILREFGPVRAGTPAGDFDVVDLVDAPGRAVTGHHQDVLTYVAPEEPDDHRTLAVGLSGRSRRHDDGTALHVVHVEDRRGDGVPAR